MREQLPPTPSIAFFRTASDKTMGLGLGMRLWYTLSSRLYSNRLGRRGGGEGGEEGGREGGKGEREGGRGRRGGGREGRREGGRGRRREEGRWDYIAFDYCSQTLPSIVHWAASIKAIVICELLIERYSHLPVF